MTMRPIILLVLLASFTSSGCVLNKCGGCGLGGGGLGGGGLGSRRGENGPGYDRPFPLGQVTDAHWETMQTNAEAADFIFYDHEFVGDTAELAPGGKDHLMQVALRLEHVPFPVVVERSPHNARPQLDKLRRVTIFEQLARLGSDDVEDRVIIAPAFAEGFTAIEGEQAYRQTIGNSFGGGAGRRFGGQGGFFR
jgi:hypothetical protein